MSQGPTRPQDQTEDRGAEHEPTGPTIRDRRRIDPETGAVRPTQEAAAGAPAPGADADASTEAGSAAADASPADEQVASLQTALADRTSDLQRLQAEYVNYKRRVDRDRDVSRQGGVESVLRDLLTVLDTIRSAREHEELSAGFRAVADEVERVAAKHGLESYGEAGERFDPHVHEALMHSQVAEVNGVAVTEPTCAAILQPGYRFRDRILRPARVAVAEPAPDAAPAAPAPDAED